MRETESFINEGYGWTCKGCRAAGETKTEAESGHELPRFFREGEAEEREVRLSSPALARWKDSSRRALVCPRCGVEEETRDTPS